MSDLISRQAAIEALGEEPLVWNGTDEELATRNQWQTDVDAIKAVPLAEPKNGKWINGINGFACSECGYRSILKPFSLVEQDGEMVQVTEMNFCYKCGADMRG